MYNLFIIFVFSYSAHSMGKKKIGFLSDTNPLDIRAWSGTKYKIYEQLTLCDVEVVWVPVKRSYLISVYKFFLSVFSRLCGKRSSYIHTVFVAKLYSRSVSSELLNSMDLIISVIGSCFLYELKTNKPVVYLTDAVFASFYNYYPQISNFFPFNVTQGNQVEQIALDKASTVVVASDWCKKTVIKDYGINPDKIKVIEFGANIKEDEIFQLENSNRNQTLQVLFLGVEWDRKGGDTAVDCVNYLNKAGVSATLQVVGVKVPKRHQANLFVKEIGFLRKNNPEEYKQFISIIRHADLLLLPTRAECAGIVFCEASVYGIPVFTYDTGGIPNYVINGVNGYRLPLSASGADFATKIRSVIDNGELPVLSEGCRKIYHERLNWRHWRSEFEDILKKYGII